MVYSESVLRHQASCCCSFVKEKKRRRRGEPHRLMKYSCSTVNDTGVHKGEKETYETKVPYGNESSAQRQGEGARKRGKVLFDLYVPIHRRF